MTEIFGTGLLVFIGMTLVLFGLVAMMTGNALARTWRPSWQALAYAVPLAAVDRFLIFSLFDGELLSLTGYLIDFACISILSVTSYSFTRAHLMVRQYPWLYERSGPFKWRKKPAG